MLTLLGVFIWGMSAVVGGVVGYRVAKLLPTSAPTGMPELGFKLWMWPLRAFFFIMAVVGVSLPVALVLQVVFD